MTIINQVLAAATMWYLCATLGILYTLPSSTIKLFSSVNTTLNRVMTETEIAFMGSISSASALFIMPFCCYLLDVLGRKRSLILFFCPHLLAWVLLISIKTVEAFIFAMFLCGLGTSTFLIVPMYINEFCEPSIRGALSSNAMIFHGVGMLISYILGGTLDYVSLNYVGLTMTIVGMVLLLFLRESPLYLIKRGLEKEAITTIAYYKGLSPDCKEVITHLENIRRLLANNIKLSIMLLNNAKINHNPEMESLKPDVKAPHKNLSKLKFFRESHSTRRAFIVLLVLYATCVFQGLVVVQIFAEPLFATAIPSISSTLTTVIFGVIIMLAGFFQAYLVEVVGRRILLLFSSISTGLLCAILGTQIQFQWGPGWLTAVFIYTYAITYCLGSGVIPYILMGEIFLPQIKSFASTISFEWAHFCNFSILFMFGPIFNAYGLGPIFYIFAGSGFFTALFSFFFLPETKALPVDVIQRKFLERKLY